MILLSLKDIQAFLEVQDINIGERQIRKYINMSETWKKKFMVTISIPQKPHRLNKYKLIGLPSLNKTILQARAQKHSIKKSLGRITYVRD